MADDLMAVDRSESAARGHLVWRELPEGGVGPAGADGYARPAPSGEALLSRLDTGRSVVLHGIGDSTTTDTSEMFGALGARLQARFPGHRLLWHAWSDAGQSWPALPTVLVESAQGTAPRGIRFVSFTSFRHTNPRALTGDVDARVHYSAAEAAPANGSMDLIGRQVDGSTGRQFSLATNFAGFARYRYSVDGTTWVEKLSTAAIPLTPNVPLWLRVTHQRDNGAAGNTVTFYTSTDGADWTQLGAPVVTAGTVVLHQSTGQFFSGYFAPSSRTNATIYWIDVRDGIDGVQRMVPPLLESWGIESGSTAQTIVGPPVIYIVNASAAGQTIGYFDDPTRRPRVLWPSGASVAMVNLGHNQGASLGAGLLSAYAALVANVRAALPGVPVLSLSQNPVALGTTVTTDLDLRVTRRAQLATWSAAEPTVEAVDTAALWPSSALIAEGVLDADGLHPTAVGAALQADAIVRHAFGNGVAAVVDGGPVLLVGPAGPAGATGATGPAGAGAQNVFVQPTAPTFTQNGIWVDTSGGNIKIMIETGF
ncbi:MAG: SGNH/GDSL hydrolase family protein [Dermatophilaceae bacterium]